MRYLGLGWIGNHVSPIILCHRSRQWTLSRLHHRSRTGTCVSSRSIALNLSIVATISKCHRQIRNALWRIKTIAHCFFFASRLTSSWRWLFCAAILTTKSGWIDAIVFSWKIWKISQFHPNRISMTDSIAPRFKINAAKGPHGNARRVKSIKLHELLNDTLSDNQLAQNGAHRHRWRVSIDCFVNRKCVERARKLGRLSGHRRDDDELLKWIMENVSSSNRTCCTMSVVVDFEIYS